MSRPVIVIPPNPVKATLAPDTTITTQSSVTSTISILHVPMAVAGVAYTQALPIGTKGFEVCVVDSTDVAKWFFDLAYAPFSTDNYASHRTSTGILTLNPAVAFTLYFRCYLNNMVAQIQVYS